MKLLRTTALTAALITAAVPLLTSSAEAWRGGGWRGAGIGWRGGGWGWRGAGVGLAAAAVAGSALAASSYYGSGYGYGYPSYGYGYDTSYSYPSYGYGYGTGYNPPGPFTPAFGGTNGYGGYSSPAYGAYRAAYHPVIGRHIYATAAGVHHYRHH